MPPATPATTRCWVRRRSAARRPSSSGSLIGARYPRDGRHANKRSAPSRMRASQATPGRRGRERSCQAESTSRDPPERQACCARHPHSKDGRLAAPPGHTIPAFARTKSAITCGAHSRNFPRSSHRRPTARQPQRLRSATPARHAGPGGHAGGPQARCRSQSGQPLRWFRPRPHYEASRSQPRIEIGDCPHAC